MEAKLVVMRALDVAVPSVRPVPASGSAVETEALAICTEALGAPISRILDANPHATW